MSGKDKEVNDLLWLAERVGFWPEDYRFVRRDNDFISGYCFTKRDNPDRKYGWCSEHEWRVARKHLGLNAIAISDPDEEECIQLAYERMNEESVKVSIDELDGKIGGPRKAENFLMQAAELLAERGKQYDQPGGERSMGKTIGAFNIITGRDLTEAEGWLIMTLLKRVRQYSGQGYHKDSAEDGVTYGALEAEALESAG